MTTDRRKAILFLSLTLVIGIFIGSLVPGMIGRMRHRDGMEWKERRGGTHERGMSKRDWLGQTIIRVAKPDSNQISQIRPLIKATQEKLGVLEGQSNRRMSDIMDSLKLQLKPILTDEQNKNLEEFSMKARQRWRERK